MNGARCTSGVRAGRPRAAVVCQTGTCVVRRSARSPPRTAGTEPDRNLRAQGAAGRRAAAVTTAPRRRTVDRRAPVAAQGRRPQPRGTTMPGRATQGINRTPRPTSRPARTDAWPSGVERRSVHDRVARAPTPGAAARNHHDDEHGDGAPAEDDGAATGLGLVVGRGVGVGDVEEGQHDTDEDRGDENARCRPRSRPSAALETNQAARRHGRRSAVADLGRTRPVAVPDRHRPRLTPTDRPGTHPVDARAPSAPLRAGPPAAADASTARHGTLAWLEPLCRAERTHSLSSLRSAGTSTVTTSGALRLAPLPRERRVGHLVGVEQGMPRNSSSPRPCRARRQRRTRRRRRARGRTWPRSPRRP